MVGDGGSSAGSYLATPTSPIPSHCAVITLLESVSVHQLLWLALSELKYQAQVNQRVASVMHVKL